MKVIHLLRKPCSEGTVAANVLRHGTGALNIDGSRVAGVVPSVPMPKGNSVTGNVYGFANGVGRNGEMSHPSEGGRWPANLVLQHLPECRCEGTREVFTDGHFPGSRPAGSKVAGASGHVGQQGLEERSPKRESVANWTCEPGCPVAALDVQSGTTRSAVAIERKVSPVKGQFVSNNVSLPGVNQHGDVGGASRFFKQFGG